jgi:thiol-disulfide isomerase/thioredoxin
MQLSRLSKVVGIVVALSALLVLPVVAESVRLPGVGGGELTDADLSRGRWVVVFWASWSPRGRDVPQRVAALAKEVGARARVVAVNFQEEPQEVEQFVRQQPFGVPVYLDQEGALARRYRVTQLPGLLVLVDGQARYAGALPSAPEATVDEALR